MGEQGFCLRWNNYSSVFQDTFYHLWETQEHADVTLYCDGRTLKCHKLVLSACSPHFQNILAGVLHPNPVIFMNSVQFDNLQAVLQFVYTGVVTVQQEQLSAIVKLGEALKIKGLGDSDEPERNESDRLTRIKVGDTDSLAAKKRRGEEVVARRNKSPHFESVSAARTSSLMDPVSRTSVSATNSDNEQRDLDKVYVDRLVAHQTERVEDCRPSFRQRDVEEPLQEDEDTSHSVKQEHKDDDFDVGEKPDMYNLVEDESFPELNMLGEASYEESNFNLGAAQDATRCQNFSRMSDQERSVSKPCHHHCQPCEVTLSTVDEFRAHMLLHHPQIHLFPCPSCDRLFRSRAGVLQHVQANHEKRTFTCHVCKSSFTRRSNLTRHRRMKCGPSPNLSESEALTVRMDM